MKKALTALVLVVLAAPAFARYIVVLKDGTQYVAKEKPQVQNGKAIVKLETGQTLQLDPALIDFPKSERTTNLGVNATILDLTPNVPSNQQPSQKPNLGDIRLRQRSGTNNPSQPNASSSSPSPVTGSGQLSAVVIEKFDRAFDNVGIFEKKVVSTSGTSLRAELTVDTEQRVFNAISAASYLMVRNAGVEGANIQMVELFMKTTTGGAAGRFQMSREDAELLNARKITQEEYFVRKVIY
ncbi:MAG TPA: hypothetical protein VHW00_03445 [Thermoanaerobaculia bacterium]|nr:hypothetical protein [Thermoanaerobaculia bacterium]